MAEEKSKRRAVITPTACAMFVYVWELGWWPITEAELLSRSAAIDAARKEKP